MMSDLKIVSPLSYPNWDSLIAAEQACSVFHSSGWARVLLETYGFRPRYFVRIEGGRLRFCLPMMDVRGLFVKRRAISLPFSDYCEPIAVDADQFGVFISAIIEYGKKAGWSSIEFRGGTDFFPTAMPAVQYYGHILRLSEDEGHAFLRLKATTQRNIRKAMREGVRVKIETSYEAVEEYYRLHCLGRKAHGLPPQPINFFEKVHRYLIRPGQGFVALAKYAGRNIAGALFLLGDKKGLFKYGASERAHLGLRPNDLVMWEAIRRFISMGCTTLSFGRTDLSHQGLRQFKSGWGTDENLIKYYRYSLNRNNFVSSSNHIPPLFNSIFKFMPIGLLRLVGSRLYKYATF